jgi:hypothetical protein
MPLLALFRSFSAQTIKILLISELAHGLVVQVLLPKMAHWSTTKKIIYNFCWRLRSGLFALTKVNSL